MYHHDIETGLRLHEFGVQDRQLKRKILKIVITLQWTCQYKRLRSSTSIATPNVMKFLSNYLSSKGNSSCVPRVFIRISSFCAILQTYHIAVGRPITNITNH